MAYSKYDQIAIQRNLREEIEKMKARTHRKTMGKKKRPWEKMDELEERVINIKSNRMTVNE